jgi:tetratricopeptide (TPR) repeat protein
MRFASSGKAIFKLPDQISGYFLMIELESNEINAGIGKNSSVFLQRWELTHETTINSEQFFIFKFWGVLPDNLVLDIDISQHEGKEIAVPTMTIFGILNNLSQRGPQIFNNQKFQKTQGIKHYFNPPIKENSKPNEQNTSLEIDRDKSIEMCNLGIEEKRKGNFEGALSFYSKAIKFDYSNPATYMNSAKVLIGIEKYEEALRNILAYMHLKLPLNTNLFDQVQSFYMVSSSLNIYHNKGEISELLNQNQLIRQIATDVNATFNAGLCYLAMAKTGLMTINNIHIDLITNERSVLLGKLPSGLNLRQSNYANMTHVVGLLLIYSNLNMKLSDKKSMSTYYLNTNTELEEI